MEKTQLDLAFENCHHYDDIVNFDYTNEDFVSEKIITYYKDYVLTYSGKLDNQNSIELLDNAVYEYIRNPKFYKFVQSAFEDIISNDLVYILINLYRRYEEEAMRDIEATKWL